MGLFSEDVQIKDNKGQVFSITVSTPTFVRLALELARNGNVATWRPHFWGGDWEVINRGYIRHTKGEVWYRRAGVDFIGPGLNTSDIRHLDVLLFLGDEPGADDWGIRLSSFLSLNGKTYGVGNGYLDQPWVSHASPGQIGWDVPERYKK